MYVVEASQKEENMDYLKQLNAYRRKRLASPLSSNAIALYAILTEYPCY